MFNIRYTYVRSILAALALGFLAAALTIAQNTAAVVALVVLFIATGLSWIYPPGIFGWLLQGSCPYCHGHVVWDVEQVPEPYFEVIRVHCEDCGREKIEFALRPH